MKIADVIPNLQKFIFSVSHELPANLNKIIVFGSYARGEATIKSDVDLALVSDGTGTVDKGAVEYVLHGFDDYIKIDLFCTNQEKLDRVQDKFNTNFWIREEGQMIWTR